MPLVNDKYETHGLDTQDLVCFYEQDFYVFSNFSSFTLQWKGIRFDTLEAAYHWEKFPPHVALHSDRSMGSENTGRSLTRDKIANAPSAHEAFRIAQEAKFLKREDWDKKEVKVRIMFMLLIEKVKQHDYVKAKVIKSGNRRLVENSWMDTYWGWGPDEDGLNVLGQLWSLVRTVVTEGLLDTIDPNTYSLDSIVTEYNNDEFEEPVTTMIKVPLPTGMKDTPEIRQKLTDFCRNLDQ